MLSSFQVGGQERVALDLAARQRRAGHEVSAVSLAAGVEGPLADELREAGVTAFSTPKGRGFDLGLVARLALQLRQERVQLVHTHNPQPLIYGAPSARLAGARVVHTKHGANLYRGRQFQLMRAAARLVHAYVAVSSTTAEVARRRREVAPSRLHVIENGIGLERFHPDAKARAEVRAELSIPLDAWVVGTVGRLSHEKDQALLLRAFAPLGHDLHRLVVVGEGAESGALSSLARELAGGRFVHLTGGRRDVPRLLSAFDIFALSSRTEGLPLVLPEAMASALPVISTAVGGIPTVIDEGRTGFLVPAGDEAALRERLGQLFLRRDEAAAIGQRGREVALSRYSADRMSADYLSLYARVLDGGE